MSALSWILKHPLRLGSILLKLPSIRFVLLYLAGLKAWEKDEAKIAEMLVCSFWVQDCGTQEDQSSLNSIILERLLLDSGLGIANGCSSGLGQTWRPDLRFLWRKRRKITGNSSLTPRKRTDICPLTQISGLRKSKEKIQSRRNHKCSISFWRILTPKNHKRQSWLGHCWRPLHRDRNPQEKSWYQVEI